MCKDSSKSLIKGQSATAAFCEHGLLVSLQFVMLFGMATYVTEKYNSAPLLAQSEKRIFNGFHIVVAYNVTICKLAIVLQIQISNPKQLKPPEMLKCSTKKGT